MRVFESRGREKSVEFANWSYHCKKVHADIVPHTRGGNDGNDDAVQPGQRAAGVGDVVSKEPEPKKRYVQRKNLGTQKAKEAKSKVSPKKKPKPCKLLANAERSYFSKLAQYIGVGTLALSL